jgi:hypothetical protein
LNFREKERGRSFLFPKAYESLYRCRFKKIEDAPLAAYKVLVSFDWIHGRVRIAGSYLLLLPVYGLEHLGSEDFEPALYSRQFAQDHLQFLFSGWRYSNRR